MDAITQQRIVVSNMPVSSGRMRQIGATTVDMGHYVKTIYNVVSVPYIPIQEESPGRNQFFIRNNTVGEINATIAKVPTNELSKPHVNQNLVSLGATRKLTNSLR